MREDAKTALAKLLARVLPRAVMTHRASFEIWERAGYHVTPVSYDSPIPKVSAFPEPRRSACAGVDLNQGGQKEMLATLAPLFHEGVACWKENAWFGLADSVALYAMVRHHRPRKVVEIGSGHSTRVTSAALAKNGVGELITIEPYPVRMSSPPTYRVDVQGVPLGVFEELEENDVLFIDSSHVLRPGSDVQYAYLEILPRLRPGVLVHVHDVFLPDDYPREWVTSRYRFWNEQYVLQAFLAFNLDFEVVWSSHLLAPDLARLLPGAAPGGSFWIRRRGST